jgi:hypothetical protein
VAVTRSTPEGARYYGQHPRPSGDAVVTGSFTGTVDLGNGDLSSPSTQDTDLFVLEASP